MIGCNTTSILDARTRRKRIFHPPRVDAMVTVLRPTGSIWYLSSARPCECVKPTPSRKRTSPRVPPCAMICLSWAPRMAVQRFPVQLMDSESAHASLRVESRNQSSSCSAHPWWSRSAARSSGEHPRAAPRSHSSPRSRSWSARQWHSPMCSFSA